MPPIDADSAQLARLQIDLLKKLKNGQIGLDHLKWFLRLNGARHDQLMVSDNPKNKVLGAVSVWNPVNAFEILCDLGTIDVPEDYEHTNYLMRFRERNFDKFYVYIENINNANFLNPSRILRPGDKLTVRAYEQIVSGVTTSEVRMAFLASLGAVYTGAQGLGLAFEQKRDGLPKGQQYSSFDHSDRLWLNNGYHYVPGLCAHSSGGSFSLKLDRVEDMLWNKTSAFLGFFEIPPQPA